MSFLKYVFQFCCLFHIVLSLYEDQAGTFDWRKQYIGQIKELQSTENDRIFVTTFENVLASINKLTGEIIWRHIFEKDSNGQLHGLLLKGNYIIVISGKEIVHCFNKNSGLLIWETSIYVNSNKKFKSVLPENNSKNIVIASNKVIFSLSLDSGIATHNHTNDNENFDDIYFYNSINGLIFIGLKYLSEITLTIFDKKFGFITRKIESKFITKEIGDTCNIIGDQFICFDRKFKFYYFDLDVLEDHFKTSYLDAEIKSVHQMLPINLHKNMFLLHADQLLFLVSFSNEKPMNILQIEKKVLTVQTVQYLDAKLVSTIIQEENSFKIVAYELAGNQLKEKFQTTIQKCSEPRFFNGKWWENSAGITLYSFVLVGKDDSFRHISSSGAEEEWVREESLASITDVEFVDLPVTKLMADLEEEFNTEENVFKMAKKRFVTQIHQFLIFIQRLKLKLETYLFVHMKSDHSHRSHTNNEKFIDENYLFRDEFNIHKIIVAMTASGKLFGLDSHTGDILWSEFLSDYKTLDLGAEDGLYLFIQRSTSHYPHQPIATVIAKNKNTGATLVHSFHPITGEKLNIETDLPNNAININMLSLHDSQFIQPIIILDDKLKVHVYPSESKPFVSNMASKLFQYVIDKTQGYIHGYALHTDMSTSLIWSVNLGNNNQKITKIAARRQTEKVHAVGLALEDRSVLYKYLNPSLLAVITEGEELQSKDSSIKIGGMFNVYLLDTVTGSIVFHCIHKKTHGPIYLVHSENWIVYNYWSEKYRRSELSVVELYEGGEQYNASAFTSLHLPPPPIAIRQAYIFPGQMSTMQVSISENGLTSKLLLFALENGAILGLPKILIDPRRPEIPSHESREEGLIPYMPELPHPSDHVINYHRSVFRVRKIHTFPTGLESTSLVFATGLDMFLTRVTPSKMFDVLKEDFDYFFISSVLVAMILASFISQRMASNKLLTRLWK